MFSIFKQVESFLETVDTQAAVLSTPGSQKGEEEKKAKPREVEGSQVGASHSEVPHVHSPFAQRPATTHGTLKDTRAPVSDQETLRFEDDDDWGAGAATKANTTKKSSGTTSYGSAGPAARSTATVWEPQQTRSTAPTTQTIHIPENAGTTASSATKMTVLSTQDYWGNEDDDGDWSTSSTSPSAVTATFPIKAAPVTTTRQEKAPVAVSTPNASLDTRRKLSFDQPSDFTEDRDGHAEDDFGSWDKEEESFDETVKTAPAPADSYEDDWSHAPTMTTAAHTEEDIQPVTATTTVHVPVTDWDWDENEFSSHTESQPEHPTESVTPHSLAPRYEDEAPSEDIHPLPTAQSDFFQASDDEPLFEGNSASITPEPEDTEPKGHAMEDSSLPQEEEHAMEHFSAPAFQPDDAAPSTFDEDPWNDEPLEFNETTEELPHQELSEVQESPIDFEPSFEFTQATAPHETPSTEQEEVVFAEKHAETPMDQPSGSTTPAKQHSRPSTPLRQSTSSSLSSPSSLQSSSGFITVTGQPPSTPSATDGKEALKKLSVVQSKLKEQSKQIESLQEEKENLLRLLKEEKEAREARSRNATTGRDSPASGESSGQLKFELSAAKEQLVACKQELKKTLEEVERQKGDNEELKRSHAAHHEAVVQHLNDQVNRYAKMADEVKTRAEEKREQWATKMEEKKSQVERLEALLESLKRDHARELEAISSTHSDAVSHSKTGFDKVRRSMEEKWDKERAEFNLQLKSLQSQLDASLASSQKKDESLSAMERQVSILTSEVATLRSGEAEEAKRKWAERQSMEDSLEHSNAQLQARIDELQRQRDVINSEHANLQAQMAKAHAKGERAISAVQTKLDAQLDLYASLQAEYTDYKTRAAALVKQLETEKSLLEGERALSGRLENSSSSLGDAGSLPIGGLLDGTTHTYSLSAVVHSNPHLMQLLSEAIDSLSEIPTTAPVTLDSSSGAEPADLAQAKATLTSLMHATPLSASGANVDGSNQDSPLQTISSSDLISVVAQLAQTLKQSHHQVSHLLLQAEEHSSERSSPVPESLNSGSPSPAIASMQVSLSNAMLDKSRLEQDLTEAVAQKESLSRQVASLQSSLQTREQQVESYERDNKEEKLAMDARVAQKDEEIVKLRRQLAARSAAATANAELEARVKTLSDQLIAKQAIVDAMEAEKRSLEEWTTGVPGTASKPKRKPLKDPADGEDPNAGPSNSRASLFFKDGAENVAEDSDIADDYDGVSLPVGSSVASTPSLLSARSFSEVKANIYTRARIAHRQISNKVGVHPTAQKIASLMPRTVFARLVLLGYVVALQIFVFYLLSSSSSAAAVPTSTANEKQD